MAALDPVTRRSEPTGETPAVRPGFCMFGTTIYSGGKRDPQPLRRAPSDPETDGLGDSGPVFRHASIAHEGDRNG